MTKKTHESPVVTIMSGGHGGPSTAWAILSCLFGAMAGLLIWILLHC